MLSKEIISFLISLKLPVVLPEGIELLYPFSDKETTDAIKEFYTKFYKGNTGRSMIIGINPGRFGGGVTGIPFTDPIRLESECGIKNNWQKKQELSSLFIYDMITAYGGVNAFYSKFYITSVSPLGFIKSGVNLNYYGDKILKESIKPFVVDCLQKQLGWGIKTDVAFCMGEGENFKFLTKLNEVHSIFEQIIPLPHPRYIMQYKLKKKDDYIQKYLEVLCL